ncbi:hypothetical protein SBRCBS47491_009346 [Sporothrix bragantina]|uniref:Apolipoprotein/apolipophorin n=1 Tax=Sporothrix bragantina TaxID=671064 RepID=A0ABP0CU16_9PEZI
MIPARATRTALPRALRSARAPQLRQARFQSTSTNASTANSSSHVTAGLAGGVAGALVVYGIYTFTPSGRMASAVNKTAIEANKKYKEASKKFQESTPNSDQAIQYIKNYLYTYVGWFPGGREYVDRAFKDVETVKENHADEFNQIIKDAYKQFQDVSKKGLSIDTASRAAEILADITKKLSNLTGDVASDILDNHPQIKEKFGDSVDQLKSMSENYGPEAKKQVEDTWQQVKDVLTGGLTAANLDKTRKLLEETVEKVKKLGDEAWKKGLEQAQPYLEKNPQIKDLIEKNADALKKGNTKEFFEKLKSGDTGSLQAYLDSALKKTKSKAEDYTSGGLDQYFEMIPSGGEVLSKVKQLKDVADKHKEEGEQLFKETMDEIKQVLDKKSEQAKDIVEKAKKEAK